MPGNQNNEDTQRKRVFVVFGCQAQFNIRFNKFRNYLDNHNKKESKSLKKNLFF